MDSSLISGQQVEGVAVDTGELAGRPSLATNAVFGQPAVARGIGWTAVPSALMTAELTGACALSLTRFTRFFRMIGFFPSIARFAFKVEGIFHVRSSIDLPLQSLL